MLWCFRWSTPSLTTSTMLKLPAGGCWRGSAFKKWQEKCEYYSESASTTAWKVTEKILNTEKFMKQKKLLRNPTSNLTLNSHQEKKKKKGNKSVNKTTWTINAISCKQVNSWRFRHGFVFIDIFCTNGCLKLQTRWSPRRLLLHWRLPVLRF